MIPREMIGNLPFNPWSSFYHLSWDMSTDWGKEDTSNP